MIDKRTRIRITWFVLTVSALTIVGGFLANKDSVIISALGTITAVGMAYIGGKTWDNVKTKENEKGT